MWGEEGLGDRWSVLGAEEANGYRLWVLGCRCWVVGQDGGMFDPGMKQIVTIFRAEGLEAQRMLRLCRRTPSAQLPRLCGFWRKDVRETSRLSAYIEYLDGWSMGDDFRRIMGRDTKQRAMPSGEVYFLSITQGVLAYLRRQSRGKHQFAEQAELARLVAGMATGSGVCDPPVALAVFREVVETSVTDEEKGGPRPCRARRNAPTSFSS